MKVKMTHQRSLTAIPSSDLNLILFEQKKKHARKEEKGWVHFSYACRKKILPGTILLWWLLLIYHHMRSRVKEKKTDFWAHLWGVFFFRLASRFFCEELGEKKRSIRVERSTLATEGRIQELQSWTGWIKSEKQNANMLFASGTQMRCDSLSHFRRSSLPIALGFLIRINRNYELRTKINPFSYCV